MAVENPQNRHVENVILGQPTEDTNSIMCSRFMQTFARDQSNLFLDLSGPALKLEPSYNVATSWNAVIAQRIMTAVAGFRRPA